MPKRVDFKTQRDFTGGLNLSRALLQLGDEESPDLLNVDVDPRGGFGLRRGVQPYGGVLAGAAHTLLSYQTSGNAAQAMAGNGTTLYRLSGGTWTSTITSLSSTTPWRSVTFKDRIYILTGNNAPKRWDGSSAVTLTASGSGNWNDDIASPTAHASTGKMPKALVGATYMGSVFVGNITEGSTAYPCRVRWSHPLFCEDWRSLDYIDIEPEDGESITALVPLEDRLLVFKQSSIHAIYGAPPESIQVSPISRELGAPSQEAVCGSDVGVMFWHEGTGAHLLKGDVLRGIKGSWIGERIYPAIEDGRISSGRMDEVQVGWLNRRLWVSVPWEGSATKNRVFVYDPFCGKEGAWTFYDLAVGPFLSLPTAGSGDTPLAASVGTSYVVQLEVFDLATDNYGGGAAHIDSYYTTRWWDLGHPLVKKRWKRPEVVLLAGQDAVIPVNVLRDYDPTFHFKTFNLNTTADSAEAEWDVDDWDDALWGREGGERNVVERGSPLGNARAVSLKFNGPATNVPWRVDALSMKWIAKRVRN